MDATQLDAVALGLKSSRKILLLGQSYLPDGVGDVFSQAVGALGPGAIPAWWLSHKGSVADRARIMVEAARAILLPPPLEEMMQLRWSSVLTSAIDSLITRGLEIPNRRLVSQIASESFSPSAASTSLPLIRLFGTVERNRANELPPIDADQLFERENVATAVLARLSEIVTPGGTLFVDGWRPDSDWLARSILLPALASFDRHQVIVLGAGPALRDELAKDRHGARLLAKETVLLIPDSLSDVVAEIRAAGRMPPEAITSEDAAMVSLRVIKYRTPKSPGQAVDERDLVDVEFSQSEWQSYRESMDVHLEVDPRQEMPRDAADQFQAFRTFVANGPTSQAIGLLHHLAYRRQIVDDLVRKCREITERSSPQDVTLVLRGPAGCGKSVIMAQLAMSLRLLGIPVVRLSSARPPRPEELDRFCLRVAEVSSVPVFVFFDGTMDSVAYIRLAEYFSGVGRKVVIIGTSYPFQANRAKSETVVGRGKSSGQRRLSGIREDCVDVPARLPPKERHELIEHLARFITIERRLYDVLLEEVGFEYFFAVIYRVMPEARGPLEDAFLRYAIQGLSHMRARAGEIGREQADSGSATVSLADKIRTALGAKLDEMAGRLSPASELGGALVGVSKAPEAEMDLISAVMLASQMNLSVPQSLALRLLNNSVRAYKGTFTGGLLKEEEDSAETWTISAHNQIEADIWVRKHVRERDEKVRVVESLVLQLRDSEVSDHGGTETNFIIRLFSELGPEGRSDRQIPSHYHQLASVLRRLRERHSDVSPRYLFNESHLIREWVHSEHRRRSDRLGAADRSEFLAVLEHADAALRTARESVVDEQSRRPKSHRDHGPSSSARRLLATIDTERACILGTKIGSLRRCSSAHELRSLDIQRQANAFWEDACRAWRGALQWDDANRQAIDAICWISEERHRMGFSDGYGEFEVLSVWAEALERYSALDLSDAEQDARDTREANFADVIGDRARFEKVADAAVQRGSNAVFALAARARAEREGAASARDYMEQVLSIDVIRRDPVVLFPYMRFWWQSVTKLSTYFPHERMLLGLHQRDWRTLTELCDARLALEPANSAARFLKACSLVHLGDAASASLVLSDLDRLGVGGARRSKSLVILCDVLGQPHTLSAVYQGESRGTALLAWCDKIQEYVQFFPREHNMNEPRRGERVEPFYLSIRFRGLVAEPTRFLGRDRADSRRAGTPLPRSDSAKDEG